MHIGSHYRLSEFLFWTRRDIYVLLLLAVIPTVLYQTLGLKWIALPWVPVALVGTATAFIIGFKNTQTYNRLWEARQIWGAIVNASRAWGMLARDLVADDPLGPPPTDLSPLRLAHRPALPAARKTGLGKRR